MKGITTFFISILFSFGLLVLYNFSLQEALDPNTKYILYYNKAWGVSDLYLGLGSEIFANCQYKNCKTTTKKNLRPIEKFDAIIFHGPSYYPDQDGKPSKRNPKQVYIYLNLESPIYTRTREFKYEDFFNWTMTYRRDSDIFHPYGSLHKVSTHYSKPYEKTYKKGFKIAWFVSDCNVNSKRYKLYKKLSKFIEIDVFGKCGKKKCSRGNAKGCYQMLDEKYKFYLSFENSLCEDYVTEKLFEILKLDVIPVVYGGADYKAIVPEHSIINVEDFNTSESLATYLKYLDFETEEYLRYFEWKSFFQVKGTNEKSLCDLCKKLNEPFENKVYRDFNKWFTGGDSPKCHTNFPKVVLN